MTRRKVGWYFGPLAALLIMSWSSMVEAQDPRQGLILARHWCTACHLVEAGQFASDAAPPFATIAKDPANTPERLQHWLDAPHPAMPDLKLSRDEQDDVIAYLLSLKPQ